MKGLLPSSININKNKRSKREKERWRAKKGKKSNFLSNFHNCLYNFCHTIRFFLSHDTLALIVIYGPVYINIFCNYLFVYIVMVHDCSSSSFSPFDLLLQTYRPHDTLYNTIVMHRYVQCEIYIQIVRY